MPKKIRWVFVVVACLLSIGGGLLLGKLKEKDYLGLMYKRSDFTLLDDRGDFFRLSQFPDTKLLLLVFTPDELHPSMVKSFREFSGHLGQLAALDVEVKLISRTNREIVRNFKEASGFMRALLLDSSGTVGQILGVWPDLQPTHYWHYVLLDNRMTVYWSTQSERILSYEEVMGELKKVSASKLTSSGQP